MVGVEWKFQHFKFGSCSTFVISYNWWVYRKKSKSKEIGEIQFEVYSKIIKFR